MRVLILTPYIVEYGLAFFYARGFEHLGHEVRVIPLQSAPFFESSRTRRLMMALAYRSLSYQRLYYRSSYERVQRECRSWKPDLTLVINGDLLPPHVIEEVRDGSAAPVFQMYSDNPWVDGDQRSYFWNTIPAYDCIFTFARFLVPALYQHGARRVQHLPFGYDPGTHKIAAPAPGDAEYASRVAYLGAWGPAIEAWLEPLTEFGLKIWGAYWERARPCVARCWQPPGRERRGMGADMARACAGADVVVNFVRGEHGCAHSMKTFELPACGAFVLSTRTDEQQEFFPEGSAGEYFSTKREMLEKVRYFLANEAARDSLRRSSHEYGKPHTYAARAQSMLEVRAGIV